jgi:hypothetical protein
MKRICVNFLDFFINFICSCVWYINSWVHIHMLCSLFLKAHSKLIKNQSTPRTRQKQGILPWKRPQTEHFPCWPEEDFCSKFRLAWSTNHHQLNLSPIHTTRLWWCTCEALWPLTRQSPTGSYINPMTHAIHNKPCMEKHVASCRNLRPSTDLLRVALASLVGAGTII